MKRLGRFLGTAAAIAALLLAVHTTQTSTHHPGAHPTKTAHHAPAKKAKP